MPLEQLGLLRDGPRTKTSGGIWPSIFRCLVGFDMSMPSTQKTNRTRCAVAVCAPSMSLSP